MQRFIMCLLRYIILLKSGYPTLDMRQNNEFIVIMPLNQLDADIVYSNSLIIVQIFAAVFS